MNKKEMAVYCRPSYVSMTVFLFSISVLLSALWYFDTQVWQHSLIPRPHFKSWEVLVLRLSIILMILPLSYSIGYFGLEKLRVFSSQIPRKAFCFLCLAMAALIGGFASVMLIVLAFQFALASEECIARKKRNNREQQGCD